jgi:hypothetical protein
MNITLQFSSAHKKMQQKLQNLALFGINMEDTTNSPLAVGLRT